MLLNLSFEINPHDLGYPSDESLIKDFIGFDESVYQEAFNRLGLPVTLRSESVTTSRPIGHFDDTSESDDNFNLD